MVKQNNEIIATIRSRLQEQTCNEQFVQSVLCRVKKAAFQQEDSIHVSLSSTCLLKVDNRQNVNV